ncbi:MAG: hypothetical protein Q7R81_00345 [Candidatus Peregrinibacteria bacterium]|nr:hypothetical protein [Candidatus Peregrinibacteria bacterium]
MNTLQPRVSDIMSHAKGGLEVQNSMGPGDPYLSHARLVFLTLHDGTEVGLPESVLEVFDGVHEKLKRYVHVERDVGTGELAEDMTKKIPGSLHLHVQSPRGIVDCNRLEHCAIPFTFSPEIAEHVHRILRGIHGDTTGAIRLALSSTPDARTVIDWHSMSQGSPVPPSPVAKLETLEDHVNYWVDAALHGKKRITDFIDSTDTGEIVGDRKLATSLGEILTAAGIPWVFNMPYAKVRSLHPDFIYGYGKRGVSPDFTKDLLATTPGGGEFDLATCQPDAQRVAAMADLMRPVIEDHIR